MVYTSEHGYLTAHGKLFTGTLETWSVGFRCYAFPFVELTQAMVDAAATAFATWFDGAGTFGQNHSLDYVKLAHIQPDGLYPPGHVPLVHNFVPSEFPPGTNGVGLPGQVSMAVTLLTPIPRGRGSHGRIYPPATALAVGSDGRWTTTIALGMANATKTLINDINAIANLGGVHVMSKLGAGTTAAVDRVAVGRVPDTLRRRRRSLVEGYQTVTL